MTISAIAGFSTAMFVLAASPGSRCGYDGCRSSHCSEEVKKPFY